MLTSGVSASDDDISAYEWWLRAKPQEAGCSDRHESKRHGTNMEMYFVW